VGFHELRALVTIIKLIWRSIRVPALAKNKNVVFSAERVGVEGNRAKINIGVLSGCLASGGTIEVPLRKIID
jgi:hypothetical protein